MLHAGLDLSRKRLDVCLLSDQGELVEELAAFPDSGGLKNLAQRVEAYKEPVRAAIESMTGARFVHDTLERYGWSVEIADAQKVKGLAPLAVKTDRIDARVLSDGPWMACPAVGKPGHTQRQRLGGSAGRRHRPGPRGPGARARPGSMSGTAGRRAGRLGRAAARWPPSPGTGWRSPRPRPARRRARSRTASRWSRCRRASRPR